jgi:hypothetical protein
MHKQIAYVSVPAGREEAEVNEKRTVEKERRQ